MILPPFKAVLFDHDGVLVASERLHWKAWKLLLAELNIPYDEPLIQSLVGQTAPNILRAVLNLYRPGWSTSQYDVDALSLRKNVFYADLIPKELNAYPGVVDLLRHLNDRKIPAGVVSNAKSRELRLALDSLGLTPYFQTILSRDDVPAPKPDPRAYGYGAEKLGVDPKDCLILDDSPTGLASSLALGAYTCAILTNFSEAEIRRQLKDLLPSTSRFMSFDTPLALLETLKSGQNC